MLAVASTAMGLVTTTSSPQDGQADLQGQPWKSLPIKGESELEVTGGEKGSFGYGEGKIEGRCTEVSPATSAV